MTRAAFDGDAAAVAAALNAFKPLLESEDVHKCGVAVMGDAELLERFAPQIKCRCASAPTS
jgi:hypothetical protein